MCTVLLSADPTYEKKKPNILRVFNLRNTLDHHDLYQGHLGSLSKRPETCARIRHCTWLGLAGGGQRLPSLYRRNESRSAKHAKKNAWTTKSIFFTMVAEIRQPEVRPHKSVGGAQLQKSWYLICSSGARSTINWSWVDHFIRMKIKSNKILHVIDLSMGPSLVERKFAFPFTLMKDINVE